MPLIRLTADAGTLAGRPTSPRDRFLGAPVRFAVLFGAARARKWARGKSGRGAVSAFLALTFSCTIASADVGRRAHEAGGEVEVFQVTGARRQVLLRDTPEAVQVINRLEIEKTAPDLLTDVLRGAPAVHVQSTTPGQGSPFIRGLTGSAVLNLVDGMRLNHAIYRSAPNPYLDLVDADLLERVEVVRGPRSVLYGSDAMGGVVSLRTRDPLLDSEDFNVTGEVSAGFASADLARRARAELGIGRDDLAVRGGFSFLETDDREGGRGVGRQEPTAYRALAGDLSLAWAPTTGERTQVDFQWAQQPKTPRFDELVPGFGQTTPSAERFDFEPLERLFVHVRHESDSAILQPIDSIRFDVAYQRVRDDRRTRDFGSRVEVRERNTTELLGATFSANAASAEGRVNLTAGAEAYFDWISSRRSERDIDSRIRERVTPRFPDGSRMVSYGVFVNSETKLTDSLRLTAGLRFSGFDIKVARTTSTREMQLSPEDVTGGVSLLWKLRPDFDLVLNGSRGFRAPNIFDLGTLGPRPGNRFNAPSQNLDPEQIYMVDAGFRFDNEKVRVELFAYYGYYDDKIESIPTGQSTSSGRAIVTARNVNVIELMGIESSATIELGESASFTSAILWTRANERMGAGGPRGPASRIPPLQGRSGISWQVSEDVWLEPFIRFASEQSRLSARDLRDPRIDPKGTDSWVTLNARARWEILEGVSLVLALENLSDEAYREHGSGVDAPGVSVRTSVSARF